MTEEIRKLKAVKRRRFFSSVGKSVAGLLALKLFPAGEFLSRFSQNAGTIDGETQRSGGTEKKGKLNGTVTIKTNPLAIRRNKKG